MSAFRIISTFNQALYHLQVQNINATRPWWLCVLSQWSN